MNRSKREQDIKQVKCRRCKSPDWPRKMHHNNSSNNNGWECRSRYSCTQNLEARNKAKGFLCGCGTPSCIGCGLTATVGESCKGV